jgi:hypothetical protein
MRITRRALILLLALMAVCATHASAQEIPLAPQVTVRVCPGAFPTDLTATDCRYTPKQRTMDFLTGSITDQAGLGAVFYGLGAQIIQSPPEWKRTWYGYGQRVGVRYTQAVGKGTAEYLSGLILNDDPRFLAYGDDPEVIRKRQEAIRRLSAGDRTLDRMTHDGWQRFGHAWFDVITVRHSTRSGDGRRIPAISRFAGEFAGAYAGYPWYPARENDFVNVGQRAAGAFGTAVLSSFWTEYHVEVTNVLAALFRRNQPSTARGGNP